MVQLARGELRGLEGFCRGLEGTRKTPDTADQKTNQAVEKTLRGKVAEQTFPLNLQIPHTPRDSHFPTASTANC
jgi:hypothetical protein